MAGPKYFMAMQGYQAWHYRPKYANESNCFGSFAGETVLWFLLILLFSQKCVKTHILGRIYRQTVWQLRTVTTGQTNRPAAPGPSTSLAGAMLSEISLLR